MSAKFLFLFFLGLWIFQNTLTPSPAPAASPICMSNQKEYLANKTQLPKVLQGLENNPHGKMFRLDGMLARAVARAAIKLRVAENEKFVLDVAVAHGDESVFEEENYISRICFEGSEIKIYPENKVSDKPNSYTAKIIDGDKFELNDVTFKRTSDAEFAKEVNDVKTRLRGSSSSNKPASGQR